MKHIDYTITEAGLVTGTNNSLPIDMRQVYGFAIHGIWTKNSGTVAGTYKLQVSNDKTNWTDYAGFTTAIGDASGEAVFEKDGFHFAYLRIVTILTGGNIDISSVVSTKG